MELSNSHFADDSERATALQDTKQERRPPLSSVRGMLLGPTSNCPCYDHCQITRDTDENEKQEHGAKAMSSDAGIAVVRRNTEEVQGRGNFEVFEELFAPDFVDHTPQPGGFTPDRDGARNLYRTLRAAFPDFHAEIHWQISDGDRVTTYKTYHGTHEGTFWGLAPTGRKIHFETVDVMRVRNGKITDHWGVANLLSLAQQLGFAPAFDPQKK
jgi:predicted ester cyclase